VDRLDCDTPIEPRVAGCEDFAHAAFADLLDDGVRPDAIADG